MKLNLLSIRKFSSKLRVFAHQGKKISAEFVIEFDRNLKAYLSNGLKCAFLVLFS